MIFIYLKRNYIDVRATFGDVHLSIILYIELVFFISYTVKIIDACN